MANAVLDSSGGQRPIRKWVLVTTTVLLAIGSLYGIGYVAVFSLADWSLAVFGYETPDTVGILSRAALGIAYAALLFIASRMTWTSRNGTVRSTRAAAFLLVLAITNVAFAAYVLTKALAAPSVTSAWFYSLAAVGALLGGIGCLAAAAWSRRDR